MKRILGVSVTALATIVVGAGAALAQSTYPPEPGPDTEVLGGGGSTAFTGSDAGILFAVAVVLLVAGLTTLLVARRRSSRAASV